MKYYDPELGIELPERSYADACDLSWDNIKVRPADRDDTCTDSLLESNGFVCGGTCIGMVCKSIDTSRLLVLLDYFSCI